MKSNEIGRRLQVELEKKGMGLRAAAKIAQVSPSVLHGWLNGAVPKNFKGILRLSEAMSVSFCYLLTGVEEKTTNTVSPEPTGNPIKSDKPFELVFDGKARIFIEREKI